MANATPNRNSSRKIAWLVGLLALTMSILTVSLVHYYGATRPTVMQERQGRSRAVKIHERTVYLTEGEYATTFAFHVITIAAVGTFLGLLMKSRRNKNRYQVSH